MSNTKLDSEAFLERTLEKMDDCDYETALKDINIGIELDVVSWTHLLPVLVFIKKKCSQSLLLLQVFSQSSKLEEYAL